MGLNAPEHLETDRLILRKPALTDAPAIFQQYAQDPLVTRFLIWRPHQEIAETEAFLRLCAEWWASGQAYPWVITRKSDQALLGMIEARPAPPRAGVGYVLARAYWRMGYMPEALRAVITWAFAQPAIYRVDAFCDVENPASRRVMEKAGMQYEGILRQYSVHPNVSETPGDCFMCAIVRSDWEKKSC